MPLADPATILHVDLTTRRTWVEELDREVLSGFLGARGVNACLMWNELSPDTDPLGPDNVLIFGTGTLTGTHAPASGRTTVTCKSPATNRYLKSSVGGYWGMRLKFAGYDYLVVHGAADRPVYLWIDDDKVQIGDARSVWGLTIPAAEAAIRRELGDRNVQLATIGPAGENLARIACIMFSRTSAAARGGVGAVMGSKNLKAVAVRGTGALRVADPEEFGRLVAQTREDLMNDSSTPGLHRYGTAGLIEGVNAAGMLPSYNFRQGFFEESDKINGQYLIDSGLLTRRFGCGACPIGCHRFCTIKAGRYAGTRAGGPEYETISALGSGCGVSDMEAIIVAGGLCNEYGLDTISAGGVVQWAMECYSEGVLSKEDLDGLDLEWGNGDAVVQMIGRIGRREGIGDLLAEGTRIASEKVGGDSWRWAVQAKGLEQSRVETRGTMSYALAFAVNPRGPDHLATECLAEFGLSSEGRQVIEMITGDEKLANPRLSEKRAEIVRWHEDCYAATDNLGFCAFATTLSYGVTPQKMAALFSAGTGIEMSEDELMLAGRRTVTLERALNLRQGYDRKDDALPYRLTHEAIPSGPSKGCIDAPEVMDRMLDEYYALHEWDVKSGRPTKTTLRKIGLAFAIDQLCDRIPE